MSLGCIMHVGMNPFLFSQATQTFSGLIAIILEIIIFADIAIRIDGIFYKITRTSEYHYSLIPTEKTKDTRRIHIYDLIISFSLKKEYPSMVDNPADLSLDSASL